MPEHGYGSIDVSSIKLGGVELSSKSEGSKTRCSSSSSIRQLDPEASSKSIWSLSPLPKTFARSGYSDDFHAVAQWFPKLAVFEATSPAIAAASVRTNITASPSSFPITAATKSPSMYPKHLSSEPPASRSPSRRRTDKQLTFRADDVRDFSWFADPKFVEYKATIGDSLSRRAARAKPSRLLGLRCAIMPPFSRHSSKVSSAIFPYPYKNVTVIVPPKDSGGAGGMEYPTLITSFLSPLPAGCAPSKASTPTSSVISGFR